MGGPMNTWQEVIHNLYFEHGTRSVLCAKRVAARLHRTKNWLSDLCRRERADPMAVLNETLIDIEPLAQRDPGTFAFVSSRIFNLLIAGTNWVAVHYDPTVAAGIPLPRLFEQTGVLLEDLAEVVKYLAKIEADGVYDEGDDPALAEFNLKAGQLVQRIHAMQTEVNTRRNERAVV